MKSKSSIIIPRSRGSRAELLSPVTPGEILLEEFMKPLGITSNVLALELRVPGNRILAIVNGTRGITADTALRLSQYFGNSAEFWLNLQKNFELEQAKREGWAEIQLKVTRWPPSGEHAAAAQKHRRRSGD